MRMCNRFVVVLCSNVFPQVINDNFNVEYVPRSNEMYALLMNCNLVKSRWHLSPARGPGSSSRSCHYSTG